MSSQTLFSIADQPYGKSWSEWSQLWWQWIISIPKDKNPGMGHDDLESNQFQYNENVIFLAGSFDIGNFINHEVTVRFGKSLFFPLINAINSFAEDPEMKTEQDLIRWSKQDIEKIAKKGLIINGELFPQQLVYSEAFDMTYPPNNVFNAKPGSTTAVSCGYWAFLRSLPRGNYNIQTSGACLAGSVKVGVGYNITVE